MASAAFKNIPAKQQQRPFCLPSLFTQDSESTNIEWKLKASVLTPRLCRKGSSSAKLNLWARSWPASKFWISVKLLKSGRISCPTVSARPRARVFAARHSATMHASFHYATSSVLPICLIFEVARILIHLVYIGRVGMVNLARSRH